MQQGRTPRLQCLAQGRLELVVGPDRNTQRAAALGDGSEVHRTKLGRDAGSIAALPLVPPDRAVAAVVEDDGHDVGSLANRGLELGHRHAETAVAGQGDAQATRPRQHRPDCRRQAIPHRPGRGTEERARPMEPIASGRPRAEVAGVGGQDGFRRQYPSQGRDDPPRMHAGPIPWLGVDDRARLVGLTVDRVRCGSLVQGRGFECGLGQHPLRHAQECRDVGGHDDLGPVGGSSATRLEVDLRPARRRPGDSVAEGRHLTQPAAEHQQRIRFFQPGPHARRRAETGHAEIERVVVREHVPTPPRRHHGHAHSLREPHQGIGAAGPKDAGTGDDQRPVGVGEQMQDLAHERWVGLRVMLRMAIRGVCFAATTRHVCIQEVGRNRKHDRSRATACRRRHGPLDELARAGGVLEFHGPLDDRLEGANDVHLLERLATQYRAADLPDDGDDGRGVGPCGMEADGQIRGSRSARGDAQGRPAGQLRHGLGHERGRSLVPRRDHPDAVSGQPIDQTQDALARHGEGDLHAGTSQTLRQSRSDRSGGALVLSHRHCRTPSDPHAGSAGESHR